MVGILDERLDTRLGIVRCRLVEEEVLPGADFGASPDFDLDGVRRGISRPRGLFLLIAGNAFVEDEHDLVFGGRFCFVRSILGRL